ncbi:MAG TPA: AI-2E family transporter [Gammaproteobacteria bacterium]
MERVPPTDTPEPPDVALRPGTSWLTTTAGLALVVAILYIGRGVLMPIAVAILLSFVLAPVVNRLTRLGLGRNVSAVVTAVGAFLLIGAFAVLVGLQVTQLAMQLPSYQRNIQAKLEGLRGAAPSGGAVDRLSTMVQDLRREIEPEPAEQADVPVVQLREPPPSPYDVLAEFAAPVLGPLGGAGLAAVLVIFILLEREDLRNRLIRLLGPNLRVTTEALDEIGSRVSRYLLMQLVVNVTYGIPLGIALYLIGIPNAFLWAVLAILLRFLPYLGPVIAASFPILLAVAVDPGWNTLLLTVGAILAIELVSNNFVEPWLYGSSTSISAVAIIVAAIFWTALWGPVGLLLATPLTVCLAVVGRYFPSLRFFDVLLGSAPALTLPERFYQRLLAGDVDENVQIAEKYLEEKPLVQFYDEVVVPALRLAAEDDGRRALTPERRFVVTRSVLDVIEELADEKDPEPATADEAEQAAARSAQGAGKSVLCAAGRSGLDLAVAVMLAQLLERQGFKTQVVPAEALARERLPDGELADFDVVCLSYLDAASLLPARQTYRRLKRRAPDTPILIGFWSGRTERPASGVAGAGALTAGVLSEAVEAVVRATGQDQEPQSFATPPLPPDEKERLRAIDELGVLGAPRSERLEQLTKRLAETFDVPISLVTVVDERHQHWKAQTGLPKELAAAGKSPRETSICGHVVASNDVVVIEDTREDPRFANNPFLQKHGIRFYAGAPLRTRDGHAIGSLCVVDNEPRKVSESERALLQVVADEVMDELEPDRAEAGPARPPSGSEAPAGA